jgi:hypothetical protein
MQALRTEITEYANTRVRELARYDMSLLEDISDLHHEIFNTDYYIIGRYQASQWLGSDVFSAINEIKEYEQNNFGEVMTDFSEPEKVANMLAYIFGEEVLWDVVGDVKAEIEETIEAASSELVNLIEQGEEFPDALQTVTEEYDLSDDMIDLVKEEYDNA